MDIALDPRVQELLGKATYPDNGADAVLPEPVLAGMQGLIATEADDDLAISLLMAAEGSERHGLKKLAAQLLELLHAVLRVLDASLLEVRAKAAQKTMHFTESRPSLPKPGTRGVRLRPSRQK